MTLSNAKINYMYSFRDTRMNMKQWLNLGHMDKPKFSGEKKPVPMPLFAPQIPHGLVWN